MTNHLRSIALAVILTGGTLAAYGAAWTMMDNPVSAAATSAISGVKAPQTDASAPEACSPYSNTAVHCTETVDGTTRSVRIISMTQAPDAAVPTRAASLMTTVIR
jgi:hypothetical protein